MEKRPVMVAHDGLLLLDDVGGMTGFCDFLEIINRDPYEEMEHLDGESLKLAMQETKETKEWAELVVMKLDPLCPRRKSCRRFEAGQRGL